MATNTNYTSPCLELLAIEAEQGFAASGETQFKDGGEMLDSILVSL